MKKPDRQLIWRHNSFRGHCRMGMANMEGIIAASTTTPQAKVKANEIHLHLQELFELLRERKD